MSELHADPAAIRNYGTTAGEVAGKIAGAGAFDLAANMTALTPVFGAIGADFLATFGVAQTNHMKSVAALASHYAGTAAAAHAAAAGYESSDRDTASGLTGTESDMGGLQ